ATGVGRWLQTARPVNATVDIAALETGLHSLDLYAMSARDYAETLRDRLFVPTAALLRDAAPPDLVLWPETAMPHVKVSGDDLDASRARIGELAALSPAAASRILLGVLVVRNERLTPVAVLAEPGPGTVSGDYEKQRLVPGGEFLPLTRVLPAAIGDWLFDVFDAALGSAPNFLPGSPRPPLRTASGVQFGALMCYDNAFPEPAARLVGAGARFLVVLSNETWFRGGAELEQLVAMTVCRALELGVPIVRATTDGWTVVVGADGQLGDGLEPAPLPRRETRILRTKLPIGAAAEVPMAPWRAALGPLAALWLGAAILHAVVRWARLRSDRKAA
ncbi:MAG: hypothetical protein KDE27_12245, partial [Planctomycetes bacterium]|nr:hypothetical protein [Planctomycetota bacterium]